MYWSVAKSTICGSILLILGVYYFPIGVFLCYYLMFDMWDNLTVSAVCNPILLILGVHYFLIGILCLALFCVQPSVGIITIILSK